MKDELFSGLSIGELQDSDTTLDDRALNELVCALCHAKAGDFRALGYKAISGADIWACMNSRYVVKGVPSLHVLVEDIASLAIHEFMNWQTLSIYKER
jgi:hypothetical protein